VTGPDGRVVGRGRNRVYDRHAPAGELAYTLLAHAEVNALAQLPPEPRYEDHVLVTALEPCVLCVGATRLATVGTIRYGAPDPYGGAAAFTFGGANPMLDRLGLEVSGPELGGLGVLVTALHAELFLRRRPDGFVVAAYRARQPELLRLAEELRERDIAASAEEGAELTDVIAEIWDLIEALT
jgi:tRNA(Arg) A34 adenosine deaminase TadA